MASTTSAPLPYWKLLKAPANGLKVAGRKGRKLNDVFQAAEPMMRFQALEGIAALCDATGVLLGQTSAPSSPTPAANTASPAFAFFGLLGSISN